MIGRPLKRSPWKVAALAAVAGLALAVACEAPAPTEGTPLAPGSTETTSLSRIVVEEPNPGPGCAPEIYLNGALIRSVKALERLDPKTVRRIEVMGRARAVIDSDRSVYLDPGCGAILVTLAPEVVDGTELVAWQEGADGPREIDPADGPVFTPFTSRPELLNIERVIEAMRAHYPPLLKDAGIGGTAQVWFFIDETGAVREVRLNDSTGREALDQAALKVAKILEFSPAMNGEDPVPVWVSIPIVFRPDAG